MILNSTQLDKYLGKHISYFCGRTGYISDSDNHCAHFVSHALKINYGTTCATMSHGAKLAASLRVQELFSHCPEVGNWDEKPNDITQCFIFITAANHVNLGSKRMDNIPKKHIGIFCQGYIWHYSNTKDKVIKQVLNAFSNHYRSPYNSLFWGSLPPEAQFAGEFDNV